MNEVIRNVQSYVRVSMRNERGTLRHTTGNKFTLFLISLQFLPCGSFELEEVSVKVLEIVHLPGACKLLSTIRSS